MGPGEQFQIRRDLLGMTNIVNKLALTVTCLEE